MNRPGARNSQGASVLWFHRLADRPPGFAALMSDACAICRPPERNTGAPGHGDARGFRSLRVKTQARCFKLCQDFFQRLRLHQEPLETFHPGLGIFGVCVAVPELGDAAGCG